MKWVVASLMLVVLESCREVTPIEALTRIDGYQLDGIVTTKDGRPIDSVRVRLYYYYSLIQQTPLDTVNHWVSDSTRIIFVGVYTTDNRLVRTLFSGRLPAGWVPRYYWDELDDAGGFVPSGKYLIRYFQGSALFKEVPWLAEGHVTALTDIGGQFKLAGPALPVGEEFDLYYFDNVYDATYQVLPQVHLAFDRGPLTGIGDLVPLTKNAVTRGSFIIE